MSATAQPTCLLVHLAGSRRGTAVEVGGDRLRIGTAPDADVRLPEDLEPAPAPHHATLLRRGGTYELQAAPGQPVWVNAEPVDHLVLRSGDVIELGKDAAVLRFRLYPPGEKPRRGVAELFSDCIECAVRGADTLGGRARIAARQLPRELATHSSWLFRLVAAGVLLAALASSWALTVRTRDLESRLTKLTEGIEIAPLLDESEVDPDAMLALIEGLEADVASATLRLDSLRGQLDAPGRLIDRASRSTIFLQGAFGFRDPETGRELTLVLGPDDQPRRRPSGEPVVTLGGDGPPLESRYTGTGWVASEDGLVLTNRHVALPWEFEPSARRLLARGLEPVMRRFVGYLPGRPEPFDVALIEASETDDLAVLRCPITSETPFLELADAPAAPGDEVIVLGYPLGINALMARAGPEFVEEIRRTGGADFWTVAGRLAERGFVTPLATRGIVGQRTDRFVAYDAATTSGGSGGPVLGLDGRVVAVNSAVLPEFGGSNLGVPAKEARALLAVARSDLVKGSDPLERTAGADRH